MLHFIYYSHRIGFSGYLYDIVNLMDGCKYKIYNMTVEIVLQQVTGIFLIHEESNSVKCEYAYFIHAC